MARAVQDASTLIDTIVSYNFDKRHANPAELYVSEIRQDASASMDTTVLKAHQGH